MKKWKKILGISSGVTLMMATLFSASFAWFNEISYADLGTGKGYTASAYFAGGDGSSAAPYIITDPIHLYNLAWLQYLGYFNVDKNSDSVLDQKYFVLSKDLDMTLTAQTTSGGSLTLPAYAPESTAESYIKRMTYIDYNLSENKTTRTVITSTKEAGSSTPTITVEQYADGSTTATNPTQILDSNGNLVDSSTFNDSSITVTDPVANPSAINLQYWYTFAQGATIGAITYAYTFSQTATTDAQGNETNVAAITAYTITMASGGTTVVVYVDILNATYTVSLNGTTVAQGSTADVGGTGYSIP